MYSKLLVFAKSRSPICHDWHRRCTSIFHDHVCGGIDGGSMAAMLMVGRERAMHG